MCLGVCKFNPHQGYNSWHGKIGVHGTGSGDVLLAMCCFEGVSVASMSSSVLAGSPFPC